MVVFDQVPTVAQGVLYNQTTALNDGDSVPTEQLSQVSFVPTANFSGRATFQWHAVDNGTNPGPLSSNVAPGYLDMAPVNDPPYFAEPVTPTVATEDELYVSDPIQTADPDLFDGRIVTAPLLPGWLRLAYDSECNTFPPAVCLRGTPGNTDAGEHPVTLRVTDSAGLWSETNFSITVNNVNDAPTITEFAMAGLEDSDILFVSNDFLSRFSDPDGDELDLITVVALPVSGTLYVDNTPITAQGTTVDRGDLGDLRFEPAANFFGRTSFDWSATDDGDPPATSNTSVVFLDVAPLNDRPVFTSTPSAGPIEETEPYSYTIVTVDADGDDVDITAPILPAWLNLTDNGDGTGLLSGTPPLGEAGDHDVQLRVEDPGGLSDLQSFTIEVVPVNRPPALDLNGLNDPGVDYTASYAEGNAGVLIVDTDLELSDEDDNLLVSAVITLTNPIDGVDELLSATDLHPAHIDLLPFQLVTNQNNETVGVLEMVATGANPTVDRFRDILRTVRYQNLSAGPSNVNRIVRFAVFDGDDFSNIPTATVLVSEVNDPPLVDLNGVMPGNNVTVSYVEGGPPVVLAPAITLTDGDNPTLQSAKVTITNIQDNGSEYLAVTATIPPAITVNYDAGTGVLTLSGAADLSDYRDILATVEYFNVDSNINLNPSRVVEFVVNDGVVNSNVPIATIVLDDNTPPDLDLNGAAAGKNTTVDYSEGGPPVALSPDIVVTDPDSTVLEWARVTITNIQDDGDELLAANITIPATMTVSYDAGTGVLDVTGQAPLAVYEAILGATTYENVASPVTLDPQRTVTFEVNDGINSSNIPSATVVISPNQPPDLDLNGGSSGKNTTVNFSEGGQPVILAPAALVTDPDSTALQWARVTITNILDPGEEFLQVTVTVPPTITVGYDSGTGVLDIAGAAPLADYQTILASVSYNHVGLGINLTSRSVTFEAFDGVNLSNVPTATVLMSPNEPPNLDLNGSSSGSNVTVNYNESGPPVPISPAVLVTDPENNDLVWAKLTITNILNPGSEFLQVTAAVPPTITVSYDAGTGVLNIAGTASLADYQTLLASVEYYNDAANVNTASRTVSFQVNDGINNSNTPISTIIIVPNSPPVIDLNGSAPGSNHAVTLVMGQPAAVLAPSLTLTDTDDALLVSALVTVTNRLNGGNEKLVWNSGSVPGGVTVSFNVNTGVLLVNGSATIADYTGLLATVAYTNTSSAATNGSRPILFSVNDGKDSSNEPVSTLTLTTNDPPVVDLDGNTAGTDYSATIGPGSNSIAVADDPVITDDSGEVYTMTVDVVAGFGVLNLVSGLPPGLVCVGSCTNVTTMVIGVTNNDPRPVSRFEDALVFDIRYLVSCVSGTDVIDVYVHDGIAQSNIATTLVAHVCLGPIPPPGNDVRPSLRPPAADFPRTPRPWPVW
jgi:hypothetical protein